MRLWKRGLQALDNMVRTCALLQLVSLTWRTEGRIEHLAPGHSVS